MAGVGLLCAAAMLGTSAVAHADERPTDALAVIASVAPEVLDAAADTSESGSEAATFAAGDVEVSVPTDAADGAALRTSDRELTVSLPFADQAADAVVAGTGVAIFDNNNSSTTTSVVREDGSLQILTVIEDAAAP
ncbi:hypothetical protein ACIQUC_17550, partial [Curtobacterium sp. NPDC098951]